MYKKNSAITIKNFVEKLTAGGGIVPPPADCVEYGVQYGWLEAQDAAVQEQVLLRKHAARMIHNFLRLEQKEADEIDGSPAYVLQDLFDCRVCAGHIIQVYVKGIMDGVVLPDGRMIFAAEEAVSAEEAGKMLDKVFHKKLRIPVIREELQEKKTGRPEELPPEQMMLLQEHKNVLLVDVRTEREYAEGHAEGAVNVPLLSIIKNPFVFSENRDKRICLYCKEGYQSKAAAQCLSEAGYEKVAFLRWK